MPSKISPRTNDNDAAVREKAMLNTLKLLAAFDVDPRPTFVVDTENTADLHIAYTNPALVNNKDLFHSLQIACDRDEDFALWVASVAGQDRYHRHGGALWFGFLVGARWKVVSTAPSPTQTDGDYFSRVASASIVSVGQGSTGQGLMVGELHASYQGTISQLEEEIRNLEFSVKLAERERIACQQALQKMRNNHEAHQHAHSATLMTRTSSFDSRLYQDTVSSDVALRRPQPQRQFSHPNFPNGVQTSNGLLRPGDTTAGIPPIASRPSLSLKSDGSNDSALALEKFQRLAEMVDVGFFDYDPSGKLVHANESWYALSGHPREPEAHTTLSFQKCVYPDDEELVFRNWNTLLEGHAVTFEMRWKKPSKNSADPIQASDAQWVLAACVPVLGDDGKVKSISGCTTDINFQKHTAAVALQRAEALERARTSEERFARFASAAPIAIFRFDKHRNVEYCNDRWFEMTGLEKTRFEDIRFPFGVVDEDIATCTTAWDAAIANRSIGTVEYRLKKGWNDVHGRRGPMWVHATFFPEFSEDGSFHALMGSMSDISHLKWAENMQKSRAEEALEAKRQQENFIDITSHEMRNPLSAMVQCADSISVSIKELLLIMDANHRTWTSEERKKLHEHTDTSLDAAQTILSCAAHQKRIVDDILTLSKLDSDLLLITPVKTQPIQMVHEAIKMFEIDCRKAEIMLTLEVDPSFQTLGIDWLTLDPSRVLQILINLITNAIKFTRDEQVRHIKIKTSVHLRPPSKQQTGIRYILAETITNDYGTGGDWGDGEPIFLKIEVQDTGRGLNSEEKAKLFLRFSQASPKTHVQYGGSGLGLFISRKLTEMQGGEIGFESESQIGSTFAFYIKARRNLAPVQEEVVFVPGLTQSGAAASSISNPRDQIHILLVEDNVVNQRVLTQQLVKLGCTVYLAGHGIDALSFLQTTNIWDVAADLSARDQIPLDIVLMDIEMPVMGGLECTRAIRQLEQEGRLKQHLPIISISANARQEQVRDARTAGVDDTITKPFRITDLMPKIQSLILASHQGTT